MSNNHMPYAISHKHSYTPIIGLEVHVELKTASKMFCSCDNSWFGETPNTHTCPVCLGLPGALPVPNKTAIEWCVRIGMALNCEIPLFTKFDRKNYFYPDLPKGYQISQYDEPFAVNGHMVLSSGKKIGIRRVHMEEDTAKLMHEQASMNYEPKTMNEKISLIDFNRSGAPLVEIVTEPDFDDAKDVKEYLQRLQQIVRYLGVADADMEKGQMRLEPNISLKEQGIPSGNVEYTYTPPPMKELGSPRTQHENRQIMDSASLPPYKVEVKNINSFSFVEKAINFEIKRQEDLLNHGETPRQETRGWDEKRNKTVSQRSKEEAMDYRYFPEPDIPPIRWSEFQITNFKSQMPELPDQKLERFINEYQLPLQDASILTKDVEMADFFEETVKIGRQHGVSAKQTANVIINKKIDIATSLPARIIEEIVTSTKLETIDEKELHSILSEVLSKNPKAVEDFKGGKETVIMFLVGQAMKELKGKAKADDIKEKLLRLLK